MDRALHGKPPSSPEKVELLLCVAMREEHSAIQSSIRANQALLNNAACCMQCGIGTTHEHAVRAWIDRFPNLKLICSSGFCGGLHPDLDIGDLILATRIEPHAVGTPGVGDFRSAAMVCDEKLGDWIERLLRESATVIPMRRGALVAVREAVLKPAAKRALGTTMDAIGVDMESYMLAQCAHARGLPFQALRVVSDAVDDELPPDVLGFLDAHGQVRAGSVARFALRGKANLLELWHLGKRSKKASTALARAWRILLPPLCRALSTGPPKPGSAASFEN